MIVKDMMMTNEKGKEFNMEIYLNTSSIKMIEQGLKKLNKNYTFYNAIPLLERGEMSVAIVYITGCLHRVGNYRAMNEEFFDENMIDFFKYQNEVIGKLIECLTDMNPTTKTENVGK